MIESLYQQRIESVTAEAKAQCSTLHDNSCVSSGAIVIFKSGLRNELHQISAFDSSFAMTESAAWSTLREFVTLLGQQSIHNLYEWGIDTSKWKDEVKKPKGGQIDDKLQQNVLATGEALSKITNTSQTMIGMDPSWDEDLKAII
jgi:hypothetical protein